MENTRKRIKSLYVKCHFSFKKSTHRQRISDHSFFACFNCTCLTPLRLYYWTMSSLLLWKVSLLNGEFQPFMPFSCFPPRWFVLQFAIEVQTGAHFRWIRMLCQTFIISAPAQKLMSEIWTYYISTQQRPWLRVKKTPVQMPST